MIGLIVHRREREKIDAIVSIAKAHGFTAWIADGDAKEKAYTHREDTKLVVTLGGDGTFMYGARLAVPLGFPVLGINRGRIGFLTAIEIDSFSDALGDFVAGRHVIQQRSVLQASAQIGGSPANFNEIAVNEVAVKTRGVTVARIRVEADNELLGDFDCDGVVVSTAQGSTAYALSAGGPPVHPLVPTTVVVPLAPHALMARAVLLPESAALKVTIITGNVIAAVDGTNPIALDQGDSLNIIPGPKLSVVQLSYSATFLKRLHEKIRFGTPLKVVQYNDATSENE